MALTRDFRQTVAARVARDPAFARAMLDEAGTLFLNGEPETARTMLSPLRFEDYLEADDLLSRRNAGALGDFDLVLHMGACSTTTERDAAHL